MMRAHKINIFVFVLLASLFVAPFAFAEEAATGDGTDAAGDPTATAGTQSEGGASGEADAGQGDDTQGVELGSVGCTGPDSCTDGNVCRDGVCVAADSTGSTGGASGSGSTGAGGTGKSGTGFVAIAPIPGLTEGAIANESGIANFLNNLYKYAIGLSAVLAVIMIIWGGLEYATQDSPGGKKSGKERIQQAILGLILILAPALVFSIINPSILNLSVHVPALDTAQRSNNAGGDAPAPKTGRQQPTSSTSMNEMLMNCTTTNCDAEIKKCLEGSSVRDSADYKVVCANMDGSTGPNTPKGGSCGNASQNLAVKCTRFTQAPQTGTYCYAVQGGGTQNEYQCAATLSACNSSRAAYPAEKVKSECAQQ